LFDEAQDYDDELYKWLRILNDRSDNLFMIFFGLRELENKITSESSFRDRKSRSIRLKRLKNDQLKEIIRFRMSWVGGIGIEPFTEGGLDRLCDSSDSIPRKLLENGQRVIEYCAKNGITSIESMTVEKALGTVITEDIVEETEANDPISASEEVIPSGKPHIELYSDFLSDLSPTQREIVNLLMVNESLSISELSSVLNKDIRSIGSLIRKLRGLNESEVRRKPNVPYPVVIQVNKEVRMSRLQYIYSLSDTARRLLTTK